MSLKTSLDVGLRFHDEWAENPKTKAVCFPESQGPVRLTERSSDRGASSSGRERLKGELWVDSVTSVRQCLSAEKARLGGEGSRRESLSEQMRWAARAKIRSASPPARGLPWALLPAQIRAAGRGPDDHRCPTRFPLTDRQAPLLRGRSWGMQPPLPIGCKESRFCGKTEGRPCHRWLPREASHS